MISNYLPGMCPHLRLIEHCYASTPGVWSPTFTLICLQCGEVESDSWDPIYTKDGHNARKIVELSNNRPLIQSTGPLKTSMNTPTPRQSPVTTEQRIDLVH